MPEAVLDTDMLSEVMKGKNAVVARRAAEYEAEYGQLITTAVTVAEITMGLHRRSRETDITKFLDLLNHAVVLSFDKPAGILAGRIYVDLERTGQPIGRADPMIAAIALHHGLKLVTGNTDHFERIVRAGYPLVITDWRT